MKINSIWLILSRHISQKWGRVLLASAGIMIGVWAISLTVGLSISVRETLVKAVNSQALAREITIQKIEGGKTSYFELSGPPVFQSISKNEFGNLKNEIPSIIGIVPDTTASFYIKNPTTSQVSCNNIKTQLAGLSRLTSNPNPLAAQNPSLSSTATPPVDTQSTQTITNTPTPNREKLIQDLAGSCFSINYSNSVFQNFYESRKKNWTGQTTEPARGEMVSCFKCGNSDLYKKLNVKSPQDMIGKELSIEISQSPDYLLSGQVYDVLNPPQNNRTLTTSNPITLKIVAVVDDRGSGAGGIHPTYINYSHLEDSIIQADPSIDLKMIQHYSGQIYIDNYNNLDSTIDLLKEKKYLPVSVAQILIQSVNVVFQILTYVLVGFGLISLVASIFGIINVMTISVLERQKEIGILKSLGARDRDIFTLFILKVVF